MKLEVVTALSRVLKDRVIGVSGFVLPSNLIKWTKEAYFVLFLIKNSIF